MILTDFSEEACKFQDKLFSTLFANFEKQAGASLTSKNSNSLVISKQDVRSMSQPDNSVDIVIDKVKIQFYFYFEKIWKKFKILKKCVNNLTEIECSPISKFISFKMIRSSSFEKIGKLYKILTLLKNCNIDAVFFRTVQSSVQNCTPE